MDADKVLVHPYDESIGSVIMLAFLPRIAVNLQQDWPVTVDDDCKFASLGRIS